MPRTKEKIQSGVFLSRNCSTQSLDVVSISPASSFHASDYSSEDDSDRGLCTTTNRRALGNGGGDTIVESSLPATDGSSGGSSGSPWLDGTSSSSSTHGTYEEATTLHYNQRTTTHSVQTGMVSTCPIDVRSFTTTEKLALHKASVHERHAIRKERNRLALADAVQGSSETVVTRIVGVAPSTTSSRDYAVSRFEAHEKPEPRSSVSQQTTTKVPKVVVPLGGGCEDDISTVGGGPHATGRSFASNRLFVKRMQHCEEGIEEDVPSKSPQHRDTVKHRSCCLLYRNDFELCLIAVIAASLLALVTLLALILFKR